MICDAFKCNFINEISNRSSSLRSRKIETTTWPRVNPWPGRSRSLEPPTIIYLIIRGGSRKKMEKKIIPSVPTNKNV